jgi:transketolase
VNVHREGTKNIKTIIGFAMSREQPRVQAATVVDPTEIRRTILRQSRRANVGHIGSCLCVVEILAALYGQVLRIASPRDPDRDRFIMSKGHAALALYAVLAARGWLPSEDLETFCGDSSHLGVHPEAAVPGIDFSTGSLGHGLCIATGAALAARLQGSDRRVFCLISDAECNEGAVWEAAAFAAQHRLGHLTAVLDWNRQQAFGRTCDVLDCASLPQKWRAFGWHVTEVDGHSISDLVRALGTRRASDDLPTIVLARTVFGRGVSYMEQGAAISQARLPAHPINWHYLPMSEAEYALALAELERRL